MEAGLFTAYSVIDVYPRGAILIMRDRATDEIVLVDDRSYIMAKVME
ncbi:MAG: hypothetical protein ABSD99_02385 [Candidatus Bathyarchaeia archaeon]